MVNSGNLIPMASCRSCTTPTYVLFADDIMVFCKGNLRNLHNLMAILKNYGEALGQFLGLDKCQFFVGDMTTSRKTRIQNFLGFRQGLLPFTYSGVPIFKRKLKKVHLQGIIDKILTKLASWKGAMLSIMGRVQLVPLVIQGMMVYCFQIYKCPTALLNSLDKNIKNFIWSSYHSQRKLAIVPWDMVCSLWRNGGLNIKSLKSINKSSILKLAQDLLANSSQIGRAHV